jgi:hypothetical protein
VLCQRQSRRIRPRVRSSARVHRPPNRPTPDRRCRSRRQNQRHQPARILDPGPQGSAVLLPRRMKEIGRHYRFRMRAPASVTEALAPDRMGIEYLYCACMPKSGPPSKRNTTSSETSPRTPPLHRLRNTILAWPGVAVSFCHSTTDGQKTLLALCHGLPTMTLEFLHY